MLRDNFALELAPGISWYNVNSKFFVAFVAVAMLSGASILQPHLLIEHVGIPRGEQGTISGYISFWVEIVAIFLFSPFGVLADRIGRRPVFVAGILTIGIGYGLAPFATSWPELLAYRLIFAVGMAATAGTLATLTNDYPAENSRGKLIAYTSMFNIMAVMFVGGVIVQIPALLNTRGYDAVQGGIAMYLFAASLCVVGAVVARVGLKPGTPVAPRDRLPVSTLFMAGLRAGKNPRIALAYSAAFAARSDLVIKGLFLMLWAVQDGIDRGMGPGGGLARYGLVLVIMQSVSMVSAPLFGWFIDRVNRVTATIVALIFACVGYLSMGIITSPLDFAMLPYFIVISLGSSFMLKASLSLVGQEAPVKERGTVIATSSMFGAIGILIFTAGGGPLFDAWAPWAPFVIAGAYQVGLLAWAIGIRIWAPGEDYRLKGSSAAQQSIGQAGGGSAAEPVNR